MRIMGLDYGSVTVGVAISDSMQLTAQPVEVIQRKSENKLRRTLARIEELVEEYEVGLIVLGLPKNMNNTLGIIQQVSVLWLQRHSGINWRRGPGLRL